MALTRPSLQSRLCAHVSGSAPVGAVGCGSHNADSDACRAASNPGSVRASSSGHSDDWPCNPDPGPSSCSARAFSWPADIRFAYNSPVLLSGDLVQTVVCNEHTGASASWLPSPRRNHKPRSTTAQHKPIRSSRKEEQRTQSKKNYLGGNNRKEHLAGAQAPDLAPESPSTKTQPELLPLSLGSGHQEQEPEEPDPKTTTPEEQIKEKHLQHNHTRNINAHRIQ